MVHVGLFGQGAAEKPLAAIKAAFPELEVVAEVQKQSFGKVLCVVVYGRASGSSDKLAAAEARSIAPEVWRAASDNTDVPYVLASVFDAADTEWLVNEHGILESN